MYLEAMSVTWQGGIQNNLKIPKQPSNKKQKKLENLNAPAWIFRDHLPTEQSF